CQSEPITPCPITAVPDRGPSPASLYPPSDPGSCSELSTQLLLSSLNSPSVPSLAPCSPQPVLVPGALPPLALVDVGTPVQELRPLKRRPVPGKHYQCSSYGCRMAFPSMQELMDHHRVHYRPTQSLEGKTFQCPTLGCTETFPSMQDLMAHMKVHYKPNRYFKCENCLLRFRTHRSLFKHLHVCSDSTSSPTPPPKADKPIPPATSALDKDPPSKPPEGLPKLPSALPLVSPAPHPFPLLEPGLFGPSSLTRFSGPPPSSPRLRPYAPGHGLPVSNAVWKKSQGERVGPSGQSFFCSHLHQQLLEENPAPASPGSPSRPRLGPLCAPPAPSHLHCPPHPVHRDALLDKAPANTKSEPPNYASPAAPRRAAGARRGAGPGLPPHVSPLREGKP
uniref:Uncharacterized protein n=1 Tax=Melopsittacus undulatus TaxID=13146 RepID=A0A8V5GNN9_MELUD